MTYPWEKPEFDYTKFMDTHIRVRVSVNNVPVGSFSVLDEGTELDDVHTVLPDGSSLTMKINGHPRTTDPRMTAIELVNYVLEHYK